MTPGNQMNPGPRRAPGQTPAVRSRAQRARRLRRRVISGALALFVASWLLIAVVLVSGHDPALAHKASAADTTTSQTTGTSGTSASTATKASSSTATKTASDTSPSTASDSTASTATGNSSGSSVSGVTTRQS